MSTILLTDAGDIDLSIRNMQIVRDIPTLAVQKIRSRSQFFFGEWFLDKRQGFPWFQVVLGQKVPDVRIVRALYRRLLLSVPEVSSVDRLLVTFDPATREMNFDWQVRLIDGSVLESNEVTPFILNVKVPQ